MLKYVDTKVTFSEIPDEISLCINLSGCPCKCEGCHSSYLSEDIGTYLTYEKFDTLIQNNKGITCISFMGGDAKPSEVNKLAFYSKTKYPRLSVAWYSGREQISQSIELGNFNYIKVGPYIKSKGPLTSPTTNQKFYIVEPLKEYDAYGEQMFSLVDKTYKFWKHETKN